MPNCDRRLTRAARQIVTALLIGWHLPVAGAEVTFRIDNALSRNFPPDLVTYDVDVTGVPVESIRLLAEDGAPVPCQLSPGDQQRAALSFVTDLPEDASREFRLVDIGGVTAPATAVGAVSTGTGIELRNGLFAVRVAAAVDREFDPPVTADSLPAPILGFRHAADGDWLGGGRILTKRKVRALSCSLVATGPVYVESRYQIDFAGGGYYRAAVRVIDQVPMAEVTEEFDAGELDGSDFWLLDLTRGWDPETMESSRFCCGSGLAAGVKVQPLSKLGPTPDVGDVEAWQGHGAGRDWQLIAGQSYGGYKTTFALFRAADRDAAAPGYPMAGMIPLHRGLWRRSVACGIDTPDAKQVGIRFPMSARAISWLTECASEQSPFSTHEGVPGDPATYGRRVWGLLLRAPTVTSVDYSKYGNRGAEIEHPTSVAILLYGIIGLDAYKDWILDWEPGNVGYPRLFVPADGLDAFRERIRETMAPLAGGGPSAREPFDRATLAWGLHQGYYLANGDADTARANLGKAHRLADKQINIFSSIFHPGHTEGGIDITANAEDALACADLPVASRRALRRKLAVLTYLICDPDLFARGSFTHHATPNMETASYAWGCLFPALIPDHPAYADWLRWLADHTEYLMGKYMAPGGSWAEYGAYGIHGYMPMYRALFALEAMGAHNLPVLRKYNEAYWAYAMNQLTPVDPRFRCRITPGRANSFNMMMNEFVEAVTTFGGYRDDTAAAMQWAWLEQGRPVDSAIRPRSNGRLEVNTEGRYTNLLMTAPWVKPQRQELGSVCYPGLGVIFRAHQGPLETYMQLRAGYSWSHWYVDQGDLLLYGRGIPLMPAQPEQYYSERQNRRFPAFGQHHTWDLRFGDPTNEYAYAWPDGNVLDHVFGPTIDYAWASMGFPDWWLDPGHIPGFGGKRKSVDAPGRQPGEFWWNRQMAFLKGKTGLNPNYFVIRDSTSGPGKLAQFMNLNFFGRRADVRIDSGRVLADTGYATGLAAIFSQRADLQPDTAEFEQKVGGTWRPRGGRGSG